jgi:SAM-dependent methyltransferase
MPRRLSRSLLWDLQRRYFDEQGVLAWNDSIVPQYVTSNPWIASAYATVMAAWLRDLATADALDRNAPLYIIELGCGTGRFGHHFLTHLAEDLERSPLRSLQLRYVYTDFTDATLDVLRSNPAVQRFVAAGQLDFARFDAGHDGTLQLDGGELLDATTLRNPLAVIANYVFDGLPQDAFRIDSGTLHETLVREDADARSVDEVIAGWQHRRVEADAYYEDASWNRILDWCRVHLHRADITFPTATLTCLRQLHELSRGRLFVLSGDKGYVHEEVVAEQRELDVAFHGSVSMMVNYHAVGLWIEEHGGTFLRPSLRTSSLTVAACLFGEGEWPETRLAFERHIDRRGPDDFFAMKRATQEHYASMNLEQLLAWLRLSGWDHQIFLGCLPTLLTLGRKAPSLEREELRRAAREVIATWFPLREPPDLPLHTAIVLVELGFADDALDLFERSAALFGPEGAIEYAQSALHHNPTAPIARELLTRLR